MIDYKRIMELEDAIGAAEFEEVLNLFLDEAAVTLAGMETGMNNEELGRAMHFLLSGALNIGLWGFANAAGTIEERRDIDPVIAADRLREVLTQTIMQLTLRAGTAQNLS